MIQAGFAEGSELLDIFLGIQWIECYEPISRRHYWDAVGDVGVVSEVWGPSIGPAQIRALKNPDSGNAADQWRVAHLLINPQFNARAARVIVGRNGENLKLWSAYKSGKYLEHVGEDFLLYAGHPRANDWSK